MSEDLQIEQMHHEGNPNHQEEVLFNPARERLDIIVKQLADTIEFHTGKRPNNYSIETRLLDLLQINYSHN